MQNFTPIPATIGGLLIGLASAVLWLGNGRIAGISGMYSQFWPPRAAGAWRLVFLVAMVGGAFVASLLFPALGNHPQLVTPPAWFAGGAPLWLAVAGLLTGFGTKVGNGCTSGHGICGLARLSPRSAVAVAVFFGVAILTVTITGIV
jgi:uncharacterized membrane protein YedE/YeeE